MPKTRRARPPLVPTWPWTDDAVLWLRIALVVVAQFAFVRAFRFGVEGEDLPLAINVISSIVPIMVWGVAWAVAGLFALVAVWHVWPGGSLPTICLSLGFAVGYTVTWLQPPPGVTLPVPPGDYVSASSYWTVLLLLMCGYFLARSALKEREASSVA